MPQRCHRRTASEGRPCRRGGSRVRVDTVETWAGRAAAGSCTEAPGRASRTEESSQLREGAGLLGRTETCGLVCAPRGRSGPPGCLCGKLCRETSLTRVRGSVRFPAVCVADTPAGSGPTVAASSEGTCYTRAARPSLRRRGRRTPVPVGARGSGLIRSRRGCGFSLWLRGLHTSCRVSPPGVQTRPSVKPVDRTVCG